MFEIQQSRHGFVSGGENVSIFTVRAFRVDPSSATKGTYLRRAFRSFYRFPIHTNQCNVVILLLKKRQSLLFSPMYIDNDRLYMRCMFFSGLFTSLTPTLTLTLTSPIFFTSSLVPI